MSGHVAILDQRVTTSGTMTLTALQGILAATMTSSVVASDFVASDIPAIYKYQAIESPFQATNSPTMLAGSSGDAGDRLESLIKDIKMLPSDWDGYGAQPISQRSVDYALSFANAFREIAQTFEPYPETDGTISLENRWGRNAAYLNFSNAGEIAYVLQTTTGVHRGRNFDQIAVKKLLNAIYF
ncbi:MAG: hypothetical protein KF771_02765 [Burkholderiales bacterium]|nr:hypothetical protein [Burkholderiales bacterium]